MQLVFPLVRLKAIRLPDQAVFSGRTAAWLHGMPIEPCHPIEVTLPRLSQTSRLAGVAMTRSDVNRSEVVVVQELNATSVIRTIADLGRRPPLIDAVCVLDMALHRRLLVAGQLREWIGQHAGFRGIRQLRRATALADARAESPMETRLRLLLRSHGLPRPELQTSLYDHTGLFLARPDLLYPRQRVVIEYDGATHRLSLAADNRRQNRLVEAGYRVLRFTAADVLHTPAAVVGQVERALAYSSGSPN